MRIQDIVVEISKLQQVKALLNAPSGRGECRVCPNGITGSSSMREAFWKSRRKQSFFSFPSLALASLRKIRMA